MQKTTTFKRPDMLFYSLLATVVAVYVLVIRQVGLSFPTPWPDEAHFLWQAYAFCTDNTLFSAVLNDERTIMWMPPGYMILTGLYFKIVGASLESARFLSLIAMTAFFVLLVRFLSYYGHRWFALGFASLFFLNARFIACGNIARMESLLLLAVTAAFLLLQQGRFLYGLLILALSPLLHFNGLYFVLAGLAFILYRTSFKNLREQFNTRLFFAALAVAAVWMAYALFIAANWNSFVHDMGYQFGRKGEREIWSVISGSKFILSAVLIIFGGVYAHRSRLRAVELLFLAVPAWLIWPIGHELWYEVIEHTGYLLISIFAVHLWFHLLNETKFDLKRKTQITLTVIVVFILLFWNYQNKRIEDMLHYPDRADLVTMDLKHEVPYFTPHDRAFLSEILVSLARDNDGLSVEFQPKADAFLFLGLESNRVQFISPVFQKREPDIRLVHVSRHLPKWWEFGNQALSKAGLTRDSLAYVWHKRDSTEQWYIAVVSEKVRIGQFYQDKMATIQKP